MPDLTPAQSLAASLRNRDTLVAAAAGSGKTAVLVERIMRMITNKDTSRPVDIDRLLVVTFTEAAATEMRQRISSAISNALAANPGSERLARQSSLMSRASVSTIHSFCRKILKTYFYAAGLDPDFKIGDQTELELMKYQVIEDLFEEEYSAENNTPFYGLVDRFGGGKTKDGMLGELVIRIYEFLINSPFPEQSLAEYLSFFNGKTEPPWEGIINEEMNREFRGVLACAERAAGLCLLPGGPEKYAQALESDKRMIRLFMHKLEMGGLQAVYEAMAGMSYEKLASYKKDADVSEELKDAVKDIREIEIKKKLRGIRDTYFFKPPEDMARDIGKLGPVMEALGDLTLRFMAMYAEAKREKNVLDFSDLEHFCIKILVENDPETGETRPSAVAREISAGFDEIMIDEYQDSNAVQELILGAVARPGGRFMVGDVKQSIYKFRRANPGIFIDKYERFAVCEAETAEREKSSGNVIPLFGSPAHIGSESMGTPPLRSADVIRSIRATNSTSASPAPSGLRIDLSMNFRSRAGVIHAVNRVFERLMSRSVGEIDYDERAALYPGLAYEPADGMETEVLLIDAAQGKTAGDIDEDETGASAVTDFDDVPDANAENPEIELSRAELESGVIARRIREILGRGLTVTDQSDKRPRPVRYGDIAVLSRSIADISDIFERQFKRLGIPLAVESHTSFFESTEVLTALSFLRAVDNPRQDIHLAAVLLSPVYGFTTDELVAIRQTDREVCLYQCLLEKKEAGSVNEKIDSFLADLARWRDMAEYMPVSRLIGRIYEDTGLMSLAGAGNGASGQAALTALAEKAAAFEETTYKGLFHFILYIDRLQKSGADMLPASDAAAPDAVRLMTVHKSKGLEFPVVFVSMLGKKFNRADEREKILTHGELGFGPVWIDLERRTKSDTIARLALSRKIRLESLAEEMRVLYVAMTRAREKLILTGCARNLADKWKKWEQYAYDAALPDYYRAGYDTFLDWVMPCVLDDPEIIISTKEAEASAAFGAERAADVLSRFEALNRTLPQTADNEATAEEARLSELIWRVYPNEADVSLPSKVSISEVKRVWDSQLLGGGAGLEPYRMEIRRDGRLARRGEGGDPLRRGTALHTVMEHIELDMERAPEAVDALIDGLVVKNILTTADAKLVPAGLILDFLNSPLAERMRAAGTVYRETPFVMGLKAREIYPAIPSDELILVHGIIDCWFEENGKIVLVDYKSDFDAAGISQRYSGQMEVYAQALEKSAGMEVGEALLYLFRFGRCERVELTKN